MDLFKSLMKMVVAKLVRLLLVVAALYCIVVDARRVRHHHHIESSASEHARHARLLVHWNSWATLSTISSTYQGFPFGNIVSYSDGIGNSAANATGELFFFLTTMDATAQDLEHRPKASVTISMAQHEKCQRDVQDPTCWKATLLGSVVPVTDSDRQQVAFEMLFSKHPEMAEWPSDHAFAPYVMELSQVILLDFYGGAKHIEPEAYYAIQL